MNSIATMFANQWIFMLIAVISVAITFVVKKFAPDFFQTFLKAGLVILAVALIILALLMNAQDLFLLVPIIVMCCELFGYGVTSKIVGILFVDFLLIQVDFRLIGSANETVMNVIFFVLQVISAFAIGLVMDSYLKEKNANKGKEIKPEKENKTDNDDNAVMAGEALDDYDMESIESVVNSVSDDE